MVTGNGFHPPGPPMHLCSKLTVIGNDVKGEREREKIHAEDWAWSFLNFLSFHVKEREREKKTWAVSFCHPSVIREIELDREIGAKGRLSWSNLPQLLALYVDMSMAEFGLSGAYAKKDIPVLLSSLISSIVSVTSFQLGITFGEDVECCWILPWAFVTDTHYYGRYRLGLYSSKALVPRCGKEV